MTKHLKAIVIISAVIYLIAANPFFTGIFIHEWAGLICVAIFIAHCSAHSDWFIATISGRAGKASIGHLVLNAATLITFMCVTVSGLCVSRYILPTINLVAPGYYFWNPLHSISAKILLALLLVHVVVHGSWFIQNLFKKRQNR